MEVKADVLQNAVEKLHGCQATLSHKADVKEEFEGQCVWEGVVHVFDIDGHPQANTCYVWSSPIEGADKRKY